jgi:lysophospholipase L1-like esterase
MVGKAPLRKLFAVVAVAGVLLGLGVGPAGPAQAAVDRPARMASLGDSITRGFNACGWFFDCTSRSWSTGSDSAVNSHYRRLAAVRSLTAYNDGKTGAKANALAGQASSAVSQGAKYATVLIGANDACTSSASTMTSVDAFRTSIRSGLQTLANGGVSTVFIASVPNIYQLWQVGRGSSSARFAWSSYGICQSMLKNPTSTQQADVDRRAQVRQRVVDYNTVLAQECAVITGCVFDGNAVFGYQFSLSQISTWDYFHPNTSGQAALASVTWSKVSAATGW